MENVVFACGKWIGLGKIGLGRVGLGWVGLGRIGLSWVGLGKVGWMGLGLHEKKTALHKFTKNYFKKATANSASKRYHICP